MTKFDGSSAANCWLRVLKEESSSPLSPGTWLERADARQEGRAASWADRTPKVLRILGNINIDNGTIKDKDTFVQLLVQEFPRDSRDVITDGQASAELSSLSQREGEDLCTYYRRTEGLLKGIYGRDQVANNNREATPLATNDISSKTIFDRGTYLDLGCYIVLKEFRSHCKQRNGVGKRRHGGVQGH